METSNTNSEVATVPGGVQQGANQTQAALRAREILASSNTPMLPLLQQGSFPIAIGPGGFTAQQQGGGQPQMDLNSFLSGFVGMAPQQQNPFQHMQQHLAASQQQQQQPPGGNGPPAGGVQGGVPQNFMMGQHQGNPQTNGHNPCMNMNFQQSNMMMPQGMNAMVGQGGPGGGSAGGNNQGQRPTPTSQEVQDALATIAAATGTQMPGSAMGGPYQHHGVGIVGGPNKFGMGPFGAGNHPAKPASFHGAHPPKICYMECDEESLSDYQCLLRKQIELFEATPDDVQWNAQGRNKAIVLGQVGIRCRYCAQLPTWSRARGAVYYSASLDGLYQAAQNMAKNHLCRHCRLIPDNTRGKLINLRDCKRRAAGGKKYWAEGARVLGVVQNNDGLRFKNSTMGTTHSSNSTNRSHPPAMGCGEGRTPASADDVKKDVGEKSVHQVVAGTAPPPAPPANVDVVADTVKQEA